MKNIIRVYFIYYDFILLNKIIFKVKNLALDKKIKYRGPIFLPSKINKFAILRSPHVNKDSRDHFQITIHKRFIDFLDVNSYFILLLKDCFFFFGLDFKFKFLLNF